MGDLQFVGGVKKLNHQNYNSWATCIMSYLQGQDLWEIVCGSETRQPENEDNNGILRKWKIKAGKAMFIFKTTVEEDVLEHIRDVKTPKEAWDTLLVLFSKKNDTKLQLLENELLSASQGDMTIPQYFHKVKSLCREIGELDSQALIGEPRMKRIIIHGLKPEFRSFVAAVQGWQNQPSLAEFENLLAGQEALAKQMGGVSIKAAEEEALYVRKGKSKYKPKHKERYGDRIKQVEIDKKRRDKGDSSSEDEDDSSSEVEGVSSSEKKYHHSNKRFPFKCYKCGHRGHMARRCRSGSTEEGNAVTVEEDEEVWDVEAYVARAETC